MLTVRAIFFVAILFIVPNTIHALPVTLQLTIDKEYEGKAVLSGDIDDTIWTNGYWIDEKSGTNWWVKAVMYTSTVEGITEYNLYSYARHLIAPDPGEAAPGLQLGGIEETFHNNLNGVDPTKFMDPGPQDNAQLLIHPGATNHFDFLWSHIDDLNGANLGFLTGDNQISARFSMAHVPEPSTLLLLGSGLVGLVVFGRKRWLRKSETY